jgi:hypothetical protein
VLGQPISVGAMEALFAHSMAAFPIGEEDRDSVAASAAGRPRWGDLLSEHGHEHGVHQPVLPLCGVAIVGARVNCVVHGGQRQSVSAGGAKWS